jgi:hypothetical protein
VEKVFFAFVSTILCNLPEGGLGSGRGKGSSRSDNGGETKSGLHLAPSIV